MSAPPNASLSMEVFEALLARLRADGQSAEREYERLRARLVALLRLNVPAEAESLADAALDRVARRLHEGVVVENVHSYALGVGRMLVLEARAKAARDRRMERELAHSALSHADGETLRDGGDPDAAEEEQRLLAAVTDCLGELGREASDLMLAYYSGDGAERIARRQRMAAELGISLNALRNRALRLRDMLERCARERLAAGADPPAHPGDGSRDRDTKPGGCSST